MPLNEDPQSWLAKPVSAFDFQKVGVSEEDFNTLFLQAASRARVMLDGLILDKSVIENAFPGSQIQLAFENLTYSEMFINVPGAYSYNIPFSQYKSPEGEEITQNLADFREWLRVLHAEFKNKAFDLLEPFIKEQEGAFVLTYNHN